MTDNLKACLLMVATMAGFSLEDLLIKQIAAQVPVGQIVLLLGIGGSLFFGLAAASLRQRLWSRDLTSGPVLLRSGAEMVSTMAGVAGLVLIPLSLASSILQAAPLLVTMGAALFLREKVGWRRWSAVAVGLAGVLLILKPGGGSLSLGVLLSVIAVIGVATRDLATRAITGRISTLQLAFWGYGLSIPSGLVMLVIAQPTLVWPSPGAWAMLAAAQALGITFYYTLTLALRIGEPSAVVPFRYSRLVFALALGVLVLDERIDGQMLAGLALVTGSGLYMLLREARLGRARRAAAIAASRAAAIAASRAAAIAATPAVHPSPVPPPPL